MEALSFTHTNGLRGAAYDDYINDICHIGIQMGAQAVPMSFQSTVSAWHDHSAATEFVAEFSFFQVIDVGVWFHQPH